MPAIAAEQNQEMQKASASTTASEDDYVLDIYGNANEDDTIDMRDLTYVKLIFFGKKPETELADAKYDGKINPLDFIQIKLIIVGKEKEITIVQYIGPDPDNVNKEPVTVPMPIERIVSLASFGAETLCVFEAPDKIVGVDEYTKMIKELETFIEDKPSVGSSYGWDMEKILELNPDIVLTYAVSSFMSPEEEETLNVAGIPLVQMDFYVLKKYSREIRIMGWMLDNKERAEELINFEQQHFDLIEERVEDLEEEQKPRVYFEFGPDYYAIGPKNSNHDAVIFCGGINIFDDLSIGYVEIDPEEVIARDPQVVLRLIWAGIVLQGYDITDTGPMEEFRKDIMGRPGGDHIDAVKNGRVYLLSCDAASTHSSVYYSYIAKMLHPELFQDIDPVEIHRDWFETFLGIEYKGVYTYPLP
jgi:iron complex transport system substrate-binding protein